MKISSAIPLIFILLTAALTPGCGSIYIGGTTHTHFYPKDMVDTDEADIDGFAQYIKFIKERMNADAEPMKDFRWTDKTKEKEEDDFK